MHWRKPWACCLSDKTIGLDRLEEILKVTDISFAEVCKMANFEQDNVGYPLTEEQEQKLSQDKKVLHLLVLLTSGLSLKKIGVPFVSLYAMI